jgi:hypothetical protein
LVAFVVYVILGVASTVVKMALFSGTHPLIVIAAAWAFALPLMWIFGTRTERYVMAHVPTAVGLTLRAWWQLRVQGRKQPDFAQSEEPRPVVQPLPEIGLRRLPTRSKSGPDQRLVQ